MKVGAVAAFAIAAEIACATSVQAGLALDDSTHYLSFTPTAGGGISVVNEAKIANPPNVSYATSSGYSLNHTSEGAGPGLCPSRGAAAETNLGSLHVGSHAVVKLEDTSPSHAAGSFTAELVLRLTRPFTWAYLFRGDNWNVSVEKYGCLVLRFTPQGASTEVALRPSPSLADGKWHHVAVLQDVTAGTVSLYVDYQKIDGASGRLPAKSSPFFLGAYQDVASNINNSLYDVDYDEFRLTPRALAVTDFIVPSNYGQDVSPFVRTDTILYSDFGGRDFGLGNEVARLRATDAIVLPWGATSCVYERPSEALSVLSPGAYATGPAVSNESCCACSAASGDKVTAHLRTYFGDHPLTESSFTLEFSAQITSRKSSSYLLAYAGALWWYLKSDGSFTMQYGDSTWTEYAHTPVATDGMWHHFAVTWDAEKHILAGYFDHKLVGSKTVSSPFGQVSDPLLIGYATWESANVGFLDAKFDALRATRGVLKPQEFLHTQRMPFDEDTLLYLDFENGSTEAAYPLGMPSFWRSNATYANLNGDSVPASVLFSDAVSGLSVANERSLVQTNALDAVNVGGGFVISNAVPSLLSADFTAEEYFRLGVNNPKSSNLFLQRMTAGEAWRVRYDGTTGALYLLAMSGGKESATALATYPNANDGLWHHVAVVYRHAHHTMSLYVDHALVGTVPNVDDMSAVVADELQVGGYSYWKYGIYNPFMDVRWDVIRITRRAMRPTEFLTTESVDPSAMPLEARFDDSWKATADGRYAMVASPFGNVGLARSGRVSGSLQDVSGDRIRDDVAGVRSTGGGVRLDGNGIVDLQTATAEMFVRVMDTAYAGPIVSYGKALSSETSLWNVTADNKLTVVTATGSTTVPLATVNLSDGAWHHLAICHESAEGVVNVKVYVDYACVADANVDGCFVFDEPAGFVLGAADYVGCMDEFRCHRGRVGVDGFLYAAPRPGLQIIVR